jgi:hypothetical protein
VTFPAGLTTIEVTGQNLRDFGGGLLSGTVIFTASEPVADPAAELVAFGSASSPVTDGVLTPLVIPTTDCVSPAFTYTVRLRLYADTDPPAWTGISVPSALGASVDLSSLLEPS